ncbi:MAG TPA: hypothetical protein VJ123_02930 [Anaerolineales bacterium]|nr:hypothetical protein [Anaerolineales bacterium]
MKSAEARWVLVYSAVLAAITTIPYLAGYSVANANWRFTGFVFGVEDGNSYIAKMLLGAQGSWLFRTPYTLEPQGGVLAFVPYILLGKLAGGAAVHEQLVALYHAFRVVSIPLLVLATYRFASLFLAEPAWRRWATLLATLGGGAGWALLALGSERLWGDLPLEFYSPESFGFLSIFSLPHLALARAMMLFGLEQYLRMMRDGTMNWRPTLWFLGLTLVHPLALISVYAVLGLHLVVVLLLPSRSDDRRRKGLDRLKAATLTILPSACLLALTALRFATDAFLQVWAAQNQIPSPHPLHYLLAYGAVMFPAALGAVRQARLGEGYGLLPLVWAGAVPLLAYAPFAIQRRLPDGAWAALAILAAAGLAGRRPGRFTAALPTLLLAYSMVSSLLLLTGGLQVSLHPSEPVFRPADEVQLFERLALETERGSPVLASYATANALPAWAPVRVAAGHGPESAYLDDWLDKIARFFAIETSDRERMQFLRSEGFRFVFYGPHERELGAWDAAGASFLSLRAQAGAYALYAVVEPHALVERAGDGAR